MRNLWVPALGLAIALQCLPAQSLAANACADGGLREPVIGFGIGGTGAPQAPGIGGTGNTAHGSGIGGTGKTADTGSGMGGTGNVAGSGSGIGGTGNVAGSGMGGTGEVASIGSTGIVGTITGFGSICVNGVEVHYGANTPTWMGGQPGNARGLAIGQVVSVDAQGVGHEVHARAIQVLYAVTGPVTRVDPLSGQLQVLGQQVRRRAPGRATTVRPGDFVQVSGLRRADGVIVASRIRAANHGTASVTGPVTAVAPGRIRIYGLNINLGHTTVPAGLSTGRIVHVTGRVDGGSLHADRIDVEEGLPFDGAVQHLSIEGYVRNRHGHHEVTVGGTEVRISPNTRFTAGGAGALKEDVRVRISGRVGPDHRLDAERIEFEHERPEHDSRTTGGERHAARDGEHSSEHDQHGSHDRPQAAEAPEHDAEQPEIEDKPETVQRPESPERPEGVERPETPEHPEQIERPETPEPVERPEAPERPEIETPEVDHL